MKYPCDLIRDLLPLFHDQAVSADSAQAVEEHLRECGACRDYYDALCAADPIEAAAFDQETALKAAASYQKVRRKAGRLVMGVLILALAAVILFFAALVVYFKIGAEKSKAVYTDIAAYDAALEKCGAGAVREIWPQTVDSTMQVQDFYMMYYNPFDANYLGYLAVSYDEAAYRAETARLAAYPSTTYAGVYGTTGFTGGAVLAMNASDNGFVYAVTGEENTIIYVELLFPGYGMDIEYEKYIPAAYLPDGLDATPDNPTRQAVLARNEETKQ